MPALDVKDRRRLRRAVLTGALAVVAAAAVPGPSKGDLASRYSAGQQRANQLQSTIRAQNSRIDAYQGTITSLQARLREIQRSVAIQERLLAEVRSELIAARARLQNLETQYAHDRQVLAAEMLAEYESPPPTIVGVLVDAHGFDDLLNRLNDLRAIERRNTQIMQLVRGHRHVVALEARRLASIQARRQRATTAVLVERDQVAQLRLSIVGRELALARQRAQATGQLRSLRATLAHEAAALSRQAAAAAALSTGGAATAPSGGCASGPYVPHGGSFGFFPAPGTNYSAGVEPTIAARLDALGRALQLQLIGISGYRTPEHSVEVGGFADDPHTRGEASDTPGVEGVPEATLERFCLTRPFGGAAEADHIQLL
jgi:peptidoglycan hydrolase CwlO-like protein